MKNRMMIRMYVLQSILCLVLVLTTPVNFVSATTTTNNTPSSSINTTTDRDVADESDNTVVQPDSSLPNSNSSSNDDNNNNNNNTAKQTTSVEATITDEKDTKFMNDDDKKKKKASRIETTTTFDNYAGPVFVTTTDSNEELGSINVAQSSTTVMSETVVAKTGTDKSLPTQPHHEENSNNDEGAMSVKNNDDDTLSSSSSSSSDHGFTNVLLFSDGPATSCTGCDVDKGTIVVDDLEPNVRTTPTDSAASNEKGNNNENDDSSLVNSDEDGLSGSSDDDDTTMVQQQQPAGDDDHKQDRTTPPPIFFKETNDDDNDDILDLDDMDDSIEEHHRNNADYSTSSIIPKQTVDESKKSIPIYGANESATKIDNLPRGTNSNSNPSTTEPVPLDVIDGGGGGGVDELLIAPPLLVNESLSGPATVSKDTMDVITSNLSESNSTQQFLTKEKVGVDSADAMNDTTTSSSTTTPTKQSLASFFEKAKSSNSFEAQQEQVQRKLIQHSHRQGADEGLKKQQQQQRQQDTKLFEEKSLKVEPTKRSGRSSSGSGAAPLPPREDYQGEPWGRYRPKRHMADMDLLYTVFQDWIQDGSPIPRRRLSEVISRAKENVFNDDILTRLRASPLYSSTILDDDQNYTVGDVVGDDPTAAIERAIEGNDPEAAERAFEQFIKASQRQRDGTFNVGYRSSNAPSSPDTNGPSTASVPPTSVTSQPAPPTTSLEGEADATTKTTPAAASNVNSDFVEGLDDIYKFFEGVEPPDELDVGASGISIQEVIMGKGRQILLKKAHQAIHFIRIGFRTLVEWVRKRIGGD